MENKKMGMIAKETMMKAVKVMTPEECMKVMPKMMEMMGGKTPMMKKMMGGSSVKGN